VKTLALAALLLMLEFAVIMAVGITVSLCSGLAWNDLWIAASST
jgi:hypothetical protein